MSELDDLQPLTCARCGTEMQPGRVEVHGTAKAFMMIGVSMQDLFWYNKLAERASRLRVVDSGTGRPAYSCKKCGLVTIDTNTKLKARRGRGRG